jgi:hypothetical protein
MNDVVRQQQTRLPAKIVALKRQHSERLERRSRLLDLVETGKCSVQSPAAASSGAPNSSILQRIDELDLEIGQAAAEIAEAEQQITNVVELPNPAFIAEQIRQLPPALCSDERRAASLLGEIFDTVRVHRVVPPGMERGYHELRFRLRAWRIFNAALAEQVLETILSCIREVAGEGRRVARVLPHRASTPCRAWPSTASVDSTSW